MMIVVFFSHLEDNVLIMCHYFELCGLFIYSLVIIYNTHFVGFTFIVSTTIALTLLGVLLGL